MAAVQHGTTTAAAGAAIPRAGTTRRSASSCSRERARILDHLLPARFTLAGRAQVFPVAVEIRLPERSH